MAGNSEILDSQSLTNVWAYWPAGNPGVLEAQFICILIIKEEASEVPDWIAGVDDPIHPSSSERVHSSFELTECGTCSGKPANCFDRGEGEFVETGDCRSSHDVILSR
jgi:hypothetical protein